MNLFGSLFANPSKVSASQPLTFTGGAYSQPNHESYIPEWREALKMPPQQTRLLYIYMNNFVRRIFLL